jgi:hypothetical protein
VLIDPREGRNVHSRQFQSILNVLRAREDSRRPFVGRRRWRRDEPARVVGLHKDAWVESAGTRGRDGEHGRLADPDAKLVTSAMGTFSSP